MCIKQNLIIALFLLLAGALKAQEPVRIDSLKGLLERTTQDTVKADLLLALYQATERDTAQASRFQKQLIVLLDKLERSADPFLQRKAHRTHARYLYEQGYQLIYNSNFSEALRNYTKAWRLLEAPTDPETLHHYTRLLRLYELLGDTARMVKFGSLTVPYAIALRDTAALLSARINIAIAEPGRVDMDSLIALGNAYYATEERRAMFSWDIAWILAGQGKRAEAIAWLKRSIAQYGDGPTTVPYALMHWTLGENFGHLDSLEQGVAALEKAILLTEEIHYTAWLGRERNLLGELLARLGREREAENAWLSALRELEAIGQVEFEMAAIRNLKDLYARQGRTEQALRMTNRWVVLKDSVEDMRASQETVRMEFDAEAQADSLASAHVLEKEMQQAELRVRQQRNQRNVLLGFGAFGLVFAVVDLRRRQRIKKEHARSEALLLNILPVEVAEELKAKGHADAKHFDNVTILFTDFKGFTEASERMSPQELVEELNTCFKAFDHIITARGIEKIKTIGDAYMCVGGLPDPKSSSPADVVYAALEMQAFMQQRKAERDAKGLPAFEMRVGIHTGPVVAGIVGVKKFQYDIWGDTVNIASRMESSGEVGQVNISEATYALVKDGSTFTFTPRGKVQAKGKGEMEMYFVRRSDLDA